MNKILTASIVILIIVLGVVFVPLIYAKYMDTYIKNHNSKIDRSCDADSDCVIRASGCSCAGVSEGCINKNSITAVCKPTNIVCAMYQVPVKGCSCQEGKCVNIYEEMR